MIFIEQQTMQLQMFLTLFKRVYTPEGRLSDLNTKMGTSVHHSMDAPDIQYHPIFPLTHPFLNGFFHNKSKHCWNFRF